MAALGNGSIWTPWLQGEPTPTATKRQMGCHSTFSCDKERRKQFPIDALMAHNVLVAEEGGGAYLGAPAPPPP